MTATSQSMHQAYFDGFAAVGPARQSLAWLALIRETTLTRDEAEAARPLALSDARCGEARDGETCGARLLINRKDRDRVVCCLADEHDRPVAAHYGCARVARKPVRCPTAPSQPNGEPHTIAGCGSTNVTEDESEPGLFDCGDCGIFFTPAAETTVTHDGSTCSGDCSECWGP